MLSLSFLQIACYLVFGTAISMYAILDGFDLGVGMLHLFVKKDQDRRILLNSIGPVWDGNSMWLVIVLGMLFAAFPPVFATLFSGFYFLSFLLLFGLMLRAVAIEFRSKKESPLWRSAWDQTFSYASFLITLGVGITLGNLIEGVPLDGSGNFLATFALTFRPYSLLVGLTAVALFSMHGAIYLCVKTEGLLQKQLRAMGQNLVLIFGLLFAFTTFMTLKFMPHMVERIYIYPLFLVVPLGTILSLLGVKYALTQAKDFWAFGYSALSILFLFVTFALGTFPTIVRSTLNPESSLTLFNASSGRLTLSVLMVIVAIGVPLVFAYGIYIYRVFKGKVTLTSSSY